MAIISTKIKLLNTYWNRDSTDKLYNDLDKIKAVIPDPFTQIKDIRIKKVWVAVDGRVWGFNFVYQVDTYDGKSQEIQGYSTPEGTWTNGKNSKWESWDVPTDDYIIRIKGAFGNDTDGIQFETFKGVIKSYGNMSGGTPDIIEQPAIFFTRVDNGAGSRTAGFHCISPDLKEVKQLETDKTQAETNLKTANENITSLTADKTKLTSDLNQANNGLNEWKTNFPNQKPSGVKEQLTNFYKVGEEWEQNWDDIDLNPLSVNGLKKVRQKLNEQKGEITKLKEQVSQQGQSATQGTQYLNKLLAIYKKQITEATQAFYLNDLGLDESDDIRPKYNGVNYLTLLDKLSGDSEPQKIINAFKTVALIVATIKAEAQSDKWLRNKAINKNKATKYLTEIKKNWEVARALETSENNNPLYLPIIKDKDTYKNKIITLIELWQK